MPAQARKTRAAEAAAAEALEDGDVQVEFRGQKFLIKQETRASFRLHMAIASNNAANMMWELIAPEDRSRFVNLGKPGEDFATVTEEFFAAFSEASGQGNS